MIITGLLVIIAIVAATLWLFNYLLTHPEQFIVYWGDYVLEMTTAKALATVLIAFLGFYLLMRLLRHVITIGNYWQQNKQRKLRRKADHNLIDGLISLVEGNWENAEKDLTHDIENSRIPALNYLGAARAAHSQNAIERRDDYLRQACDTTERAKAAITIAQAEMQLSGGQLEQARAGLITLLEENPKHRHAKKLLAKSYYRQEDWKNLASLVQENIKAGFLNDSEILKYEDASLKGLFQMYATEDDLRQLRSEWKKLPAAVKAKPHAVFRYCKALIAAGENAEAMKLLTSTINRQWDDKLVELYGSATHKNLNDAIVQAEKWLPEHENNPALLLTLARLYSANKLWGKSRSLYESSLNLAPDTRAYLELGFLLELIDDPIENILSCYRAGLLFSITQRAEPLILQARNKQKTSPPPATPGDEEITVV